MFISWFILPRQKSYGWWNCLLHGKVRKVQFISNKSWLNVTTMFSSTCFPQENRVNEILKTNLKFCDEKISAIKKSSWVLQDFWLTVNLQIMINNAPTIFTFFSKEIDLTTEACKIRSKISEAVTLQKKDFEWLQTSAESKIYVPLGYFTFKTFNNRALKVFNDEFWRKFFWKNKRKKS